MVRQSTLVLLVLAACAGPVDAEVVSRVSIGCDTPAATLMAEQALQDKLNGRDRNAFSRIDDYRKQAGADACRPLSQGDEVVILREQDDLVCVRERDERLNGPDAPACYWMRRRFIKLPQ